MLTKEDLVLVDAIRDTGSLSKAAALLLKAPSTVSHMVRQLEQRFDVLLFDRRGYRLQLTGAGHLLAEEGRRIIADVDRLNKKLQQVAHGWEDRFWIVTDELLEIEHFLPLIQEFNQVDSGVSLRLTHEVLKGTWEALLDGRADLIIGATNEPPAKADINWIELGALEWVFAVSNQHPLAKVSGVITTDELKKHCAIVVADSTRKGLGRTYGVLSGQQTLALPSMRSKVLAQCAGLGVGWLPRGRVKTLLEAGVLVEKTLANPREPNMLYIAWSEANKGRALEWWLDKVRQPKFVSNLIAGISWNI